MLGNLFEAPGITFTHGANIYSGLNPPTSIVDVNGKPIPEGSLYISVTAGNYKLVNGVWKMMTLPAPQSTVNRLLYENAGEMALAGQVMIDNGELTLISGGAQTKPANDQTKLCANSIAGVSLPLFTSKTRFGRNTLRGGSRLGIAPLA